MSINASVKIQVASKGIANALKTRDFVVKIALVPVARIKKKISISSFKLETKLLIKILLLLLKKEDIMDVGVRKITVP